MTKIILILPDLVKKTLNLVTLCLHLLGPGLVVHSHPVDVEVGVVEDFVHDSVEFWKQKVIFNF